MSVRFNVDDVVRIARVPLKYLPRMEGALGEIGFVAELHADGERVLFHGLKLPGRPTKHTAWVRCAWLEPFGDAAWAAAVAEYRRYAARVADDVRECERRRQRHIRDVAEKYGMTVERVMEIADAVYPMGR